MNVLLHRFKIHFLLLPIFMMAMSIASGQSPSMEVHQVAMLKDGTLAFPFFNDHGFNGSQKKQPESSEPAYDYSHFSNGNKKIGIANGNDTIFYTPPQGFVGRDTIEILRWIEDANHFPQVAYIILHITVYPSHITAMPDYVSTLQGQAIEIEVLANDYGNGTNQTIAEVTNKNRGDAVLINGNTKVLFTPPAGYIGLSHFNYSICDIQGACDMTTVNICVMDPNPPAYDSINVQTKEGESQVILMALDSNYSVSLNPVNGSVVDTGEVLIYEPNTSFSGIDKVIFEDTINNRIRVFQIDVIGPAPYRGIYLRDDIVYTAMDETVDEIHLLTNDIGGAYMQSVGRVNGSTTAMGGTTFYVAGSGLGVYGYIPPPGFTGVDYFKYKATLPGSSPAMKDTATCYIIVNNLLPSIPVYDLNVPTETPLVLGNNLPFLSYDYQIVSQPDPTKGTLIYLPGQDSYTSQYGQTVSGYNMLVYEPLPNISGSDQFEVEYCVPDVTGLCQLVKVELEIDSISNPQSDTLCAGSNCVWPGDTDKDGKVDINDLLPIGLTMGEVGMNRQITNNNWYAQHGDDWNSLNISGLPFDIKHADTDGNGIVSSMDTTAIGQYYGKYNNIVPNATAPISDLPFYPGSFPGNPQPGDVILIPLHLGDINNPAFDAYGLTFSVDYDPLFFESVNVYWNDDAWMNYNSPVLSMNHKPYAGKLDAGYTRTSGLAATGHGIIGVLEFIVIEDVTGIRPSDEYSVININGNLMNSSGQNSNLGNHTMTFSLGLNEDGHTEENVGLTTNDLKVFPNPGKESINIHLNGGQDNLMERIALYNMVGSQVYDSSNILSKRTSLNVSDLNPGVYVLRVWANGEMLTSKVEIFK